MVSAGALILSKTKQNTTQNKTKQNLCRHLQVFYWAQDRALQAGGYLGPHLLELGHEIPQSTLPLGWPIHTAHQMYSLRTLKH